MRVPRYWIVGLLLVWLAVPSLAQGPIEHGIILSKGCDPVVYVGEPYTFTCTISNFPIPGGDNAGDTLRVKELHDRVVTAGGPVDSGDLLHTLDWTLYDGAYWDTGNGQLVLPSGSYAQSAPYSFYTVQPADALQPVPLLYDILTITWWDTCNKAGTGCPVGDQYATTGASATAMFPPPCIEISKSVSCEVSKVGDTVTYHYCVHNCGPLELEITGIDDTVVPDLTDAFAAAGCFILAPDDGSPGGYDECCFDVPYTILPKDDDGEPLTQLTNEVTVYAQDTLYAQDVSASDDATVILVHPGLVVRKSCVNPDQQVEPGGVAMFEIEVENTGDVCLVVVVEDPDTLSLDCGPFTLAPGAIETCQVEIDVPADTMATEIINHVRATWTICEPPRVVGECLDNTGTVEAQAACDVVGGATRTPGFWKTHYNYTAHILADYIPACVDVDLDGDADTGGIDLGWIRVCSMDEVCAVFWANNANNSDGSKRTALGQARMHASFHALAAIFNNAMPSGGGIPVPPADIAAILGGEDVDAIKALASLLADYNESGDDVAIMDPWGPPGSATPRECKSVDLSFADSEAAGKPGKGNKK